MTTVTLDVSRWILPLATAVGAFGGFPEPPKMFIDLVRNEIFQWLMVFVLVWQGGGQQNVRTAATTTVILFLLTKALNRLMPTAPAMLMPAPPAGNSPVPPPETFMY